MHRLSLPCFGGLGTYRFLDELTFTDFADHEYGEEVDVHTVRWLLGHPE